MKNKKTSPNRKQLSANAKKPSSTSHHSRLRMWPSQPPRRHRCKSPALHADVIHDLNRFPYPFPNKSVRRDYLRQYYRTPGRQLKVMEELHRIAKPSALVDIVLPFYCAQQAHTDPTRRHFFGVHSFDYFIDERHGECRVSIFESRLLHCYRLSLKKS